MDTNTLSMIQQRTEWFRHDRFGMFIHWGLYAIPGRGEWIRNGQRLSVADYQPYFDAFNPVDYRPTEWAKLAKAAGMKYMVLTAKHHDGFCLFDSAYTDYKATNTHAKRDLVREFVEAARNEGLKVGLYYSLLDWHHDDYPKYHDLHHPMRGNDAYKDEVIDFNNYLTYMHNQVEELVTNYGKIDILWFDFSYEGMSGEQWQATKLIEMVRRHQPDVLVDNRLEGSGEGFGSIVTDNISYYAGDFVSPEQQLPQEGIRNQKGELIPWELCVTMNNHWGYNPYDKTYKSAKMLIRKLVECVSKNGNMLLNVGPDALGAFPTESVAVLETFAKWIHRNGESIYGCGLSALPKPEWGYYTQNDKVIYAHIFEPQIGPIYLPGIDASDIQSLSLLHDGSEVKVSDSWTTKAYPGRCFVQYAEGTYPLPDEIDTVIKIILK